MPHSITTTVCPKGAARRKEKAKARAREKAKERRTKVNKVEMPWRLLRRIRIGTIAPRARVSGTGKQGHVLTVPAANINTTNGSLGMRRPEQDNHKTHENEKEKEKGKEKAREKGAAAMEQPTSQHTMQVSCRRLL